MMIISFQTLISKMGVLQSTLLYFILLHSINIVAYKDQEWKKATATYAKDTEGSLITGTFLAPPLVHNSLVL